MNFLKELQKDIHMVQKLNHKVIWPPPPLPRYPFIFKCSSVSLLPNGPHDTKRSCLPLLSKVQGITSQTCLSERIFTLSFNTNLLIPSNASLYITMYNQLYTLNMVQIMTIKSKGKGGRQCLCALFIGKFSKRNNWGRKDNPYILTRESVRA